MSRDMSDMPMEMRYPAAVVPRMPSAGMRRRPHTMSSSGERNRALTENRSEKKYTTTKKPPMTSAVDNDEWTPAPSGN